VGSAFGYRQVIEPLRRAGYPLAVVDPLGMGGSSAPGEADYSLTAQAARIRLVLDTLGWERVVVVGASTSGTMALRLAADEHRRGTGRVIGVVSLAGGATDTQATTGARQVLALSPLLNSGVVRALGRRALQVQLKARSGNPAWCTREVMEGYAASVSANLARRLRALAAMGRAREPEPIRHALPAVQLPVVVLVGGIATPGTPAQEELALLRNLLPRGEVRTLPGVGSMIAEEAPGAVVNAVEWLAGPLVVGGGTP
jgi:pimeloyl-ACP methyl ester carboxylesterase